MLIWSTASLRDDWLQLKRLRELSTTNLAQVLKPLGNLGDQLVMLAFFPVTLALPAGGRWTVPTQKKDFTLG